MKKIATYKVFRRTTIHCVIPHDVFVQWVDWFTPVVPSVLYEELTEERKCIERISHYHTYINDCSVAVPAVCLTDFRDMITDYPYDSERSPRTLSLETNLILPRWPTMTGDQVFPYRMARLRGPTLPLPDDEGGDHE